MHASLGFPHSSAGKESTCNAGDASSIPGAGRSAEEGIGYPLQYSWTSIVAQPVKNTPAIWETLVRFLGWEDPLKKEKSTHSSILAWRIPWTIQSMSWKELDKTKWLSLSLRDLCRIPHIWKPSECGKRLRGQRIHLRMDIGESGSMTMTINILTMSIPEAPLGQKDWELCTI